MAARATNGTEAKLKETAATPPSVVDDKAPAYPHMVPEDAIYNFDERDASILLDRRHLLLLSKIPRRLTSPFSGLLSEARFFLQLARTEFPKDAELAAKWEIMYNGLVYDLELISGSSGRSDQVVDIFHGARKAPTRLDDALPQRDDAREERPSLFGGGGLS